MIETWTRLPRLTIVTGHSGSGKTEFSVNLALALASQGRKAALADLDVVNPYFRSRERRLLLREHGILLIASSQACVDADVPSMPAELNLLFENKELTGVLDIGGNRTGARVLARYGPQLAGQSFQALFVLNANRPLTSAPEAAVRCLRGIEDGAGVQITGIVNNTHLCRETTVEDIYRGAALAEAVSARTGIPVVCHAVPRMLAGPVTARKQPVFPLDIYMAKPWEATLTPNRKEA